MSVEKRIMGSSRITSFWSTEDGRTITATVLFWSDGTITWTRE